MRNKFLFTTLLCSVAVSMWGQRKEFTIRGAVAGMRDGVNVAVITRDSISRTLAETVVKDGKFELCGTVDRPCQATFITNNLQLVNDNNWPMDSVKWTYTDCYIDNVEMILEARHYDDVPSDWIVTDQFCLKGGQVQSDYNDYGRMLYERTGKDRQKAGEVEQDVIWDFIASHPHSVVSLDFASQMLRRGYRLTKSDVERLENTITEVPGNPVAFSEFKEQLEYARNTVVGASMVDLEMKDTEGNVLMLSSVVSEGKYVLVDFWASWCGMCLYAMPDVKQIAEDYPEDFVVVGLSCDKDDEAWRKAMERVNMPWAQYVLTSKGYADFFTKYQVGNGVPYYMLIAPDGSVMKTPSHPSDVRKVLDAYLGYRNLELEIFSRSDKLATEKLLECGSYADCVAYMREQVRPLEERLSRMDDAGFVARKKAEMESAMVSFGYNYAIACEQNGRKMEKDPDFMQVVDRLDLNDPKQMNDIQSFLTWYRAAHAKEYAQLSDEAAKLRIAKKLISNQDVLNECAQSVITMHAFLMMFGGSAEIPADVYREMLTVTTDEAMQDLARKELTKAEYLQKGAEPAELKMVDMDGNTVSLKDIVGGGRYTYIDFWATWCGPCVKEIPYLDKLAAEYNGGKIRIVSISLDENAEKWTQKLEADRPSWAQYRMPKEWQDACVDCYGITGIPRFMLFDKKGRMFDGSAPRPSDEKLKELFNQFK